MLSSGSTSNDNDKLKFVGHRKSNHLRLEINPVNPVNPVY